MTHYKETTYGFEYGAAKIARQFSDKGKVWIGLETPKAQMQIYVTKTGKVRVFKGDVELLPEDK